MILASCIYNIASFFILVPRRRRENFYAIKMAEKGIVEQMYDKEIIFL